MCFSRFIILQRCGYAIFICSKSCKLLVPYNLIISYFNPRTHEGCDCHVHRQPRRRYAISIHAPVKGATRGRSWGRWEAPLFQSTHPWRVRLHIGPIGQDNTGISIHAPVKGATGEKIVRKKNAWDISIHAPVKGATSRGRRFFPDLRISIHAPVKGATTRQLKTFRIARLVLCQVWVQIKLRFLSISYPAIKAAFFL